MKKLLILTGVLLTLIVLYPQKTGEIFSELKTTIFSHFYSETVKGSDLVKRNGLYYKKHTDVPFTGKEENYFENGQLNSKGHYKGGNKEGLWEVYFKDGKLQSKGYWKDRKRNGSYESYTFLGHLDSKGHYKDGKKDGLWEFYQGPSSLWHKGHYKDGKKEGLWEWFLMDGTVDQVNTYTFRNGEIVKE